MFGRQPSPFLDAQRIASFDAMRRASLVPDFDLGQHNTL
jgi:hypothetical protein